jgi:4'-phosphopantetheinyl transferase
MAGRPELQVHWIEDLDEVPRGPIPHGHVRVLLAASKLADGRHENLLSSRELMAIRRLRRPADRDGKRTSRVLLRTAVGVTLDVSPEALHLQRHCHACSGPHGAPLVLGHDIEVSLSHTAGVVAVALHASTPVGVDVEAIGTIFDEPATAPRILSPEELGQANFTPSDLAMIWTRKEALLKASGHGLAVAPSSVWLTSTGPLGRLRLGGVDRDFWLQDVGHSQLGARATVAAVALLPPANSGAVNRHPFG